MKQGNPSPKKNSKKKPPEGGTAKRPAGPPSDVKRGLNVPSILLEGDNPPPTAAGPGKRYALGPQAPEQSYASKVEQLGDLPDAYGTKKLLLTARDPHWLYAHWDLSSDQLKLYNAKSAQGHLSLRIFRDAIEGQPLAVIAVHPESRNWFVHVEMGGARYLAELGYADKHGKWVSISVSPPTLTPPDSISDDTSVRFATIPIDIPFEYLVEVVKAALGESVPLVEAILQLRAQGFKNLPTQQQIEKKKWTSAQERALAKVITMDEVRRVWIGSLEVTELVRRQLSQDLSSMAASQWSLPTSPGGAISSISSISSAFGGMPARPGFWFNINAELIIYGATEPDAKVTIGGRQIRLRPDGTFSFRFILPDGAYDLAAMATAADGHDSRKAELHFVRSTRYTGEVGGHPQDPRMTKPDPANVS